MSMPCKMTLLRVNIGKERPIGLDLLSIHRYVIIDVDDIITIFNKKK